MNQSEDHVYNDDHDENDLIDYSDLIGDDQVELDLIKRRMGDIMTVGFVDIFWFIFWIDLLMFMTIIGNDNNADDGDIMLVWVWVCLWL